MTNNGFVGFDAPEENWSKLPHQFIDIMPQIETMGEMKILIYTLRHTWGYGDDHKRISLDDYEFGRKRRDGTRIDNGTGLSKPTIINGIRRGVKHKFLFEYVDKGDKARVKKYYSLTKGGLSSFTPDVKELDIEGQKPLHRTWKDTSEGNSGENSAGAKVLPFEDQIGQFVSEAAQGAALYENMQIIGGGEDEFTETFGDNPRQDEIDAWGDRKPTTEDELLLIAMGVGVAPEIRAKLAQIRDAGWQVKDSEVEVALAQFLAITGFIIPTTTSTRKLFLVGIREHFEEEHFKGRLGELYKTVWADIGDDVRNGLNITHPRAFTKGMYRIVNVEAGKDLRNPAASLSRSDMLDTLLSKGVVEWVETEPDKFAPCWAGTTDFVKEIPQTILDEHF